MNKIEIKNKLEVGQDGKVQIPGCEPVSSLTSLALLRNFRCDNPRIHVKDILRIIPGSKLVRVTTPLGHIASGMFVELPSGPPPDGNECPGECLPDWYKIMREFESEQPAKTMPECAGFDYSGCPIEPDDIRKPRDPLMRPNSQPLQPS